MNDLIVDNPTGAADPGTLAGARAFASAQALHQSETDLEKGLNGTVMALDILAMVMNPLKELMMAGVGFLIEHVGPLQDFLEILAGSPEKIGATRDTWLNIQQALHQAGDDLAAESSLDDWKGDAADAYRNTIANFEGALKAAAESSGSIAKYMNAMGVWTAITRALILELICDFVSRVIIYALSALASAWFTFGGSIAAMISGVIADALLLIAKLSQHIAKLGQAMSSLAGRFPKVAGFLDDAGEAVSKFGSKMGNKADTKALDWQGKAHLQSIPPPLPSSGTVGGPLGRDSWKGMQFDSQKHIYDALSDPLKKVPHTSGLTDKTRSLYYNETKLIDGRSVSDVITGYPMTGAKGGVGAAPAAAQAGPTEEDEKE
ncbi:MAG TPA: hypothetical protein VKZ65_14875 [Glycomyces sp.]|nr:hypothetical protein [Glycomyces sp.]